MLEEYLRVNFIPCSWTRLEQQGPSKVISQVERRELPEHAVIIDGGTAVLKTLENMSDFDGLVIVDAASMGEPAGAVKSFNLNEILLSGPDGRITLHGIKMDTELLYANKFLSLPPTIIVGIEPESLTRSGISDILLARLDSYVDAVSKAIRQLSY